jgi:hypothetical protein
LVRQLEKCLYGFGSVPYPLSLSLSLLEEDEEEQEDIPEGAGLGRIGED